MTVEFGLRNNGSAAQSLGDRSASFEVAGGGATYNAELKETGVPTLPAGVSVCGKAQPNPHDGSNEIVAPSAVVDIPHALQPTKLDVTGFPSIDLTARFNSAACKPTLQPGVPEAPTSVTPAGMSATVKVEGVGQFPQVPEHGRVRLNAQVINDDKYSDLTLTDVNFWLLDEDGVARLPISQNTDYGVWEDANCDIEHLDNGELSVPPAGTANARPCYVYRSNQSPAALIVQNETSDPSVVRLPARH
ncbi:hypothetical protein ACFW1M_11360 [Streptomyces inhibens]|uniref:hypothetical protein n=1 Tax=Streptomyces inhibens TaxID=2293571 RepID=UPI0036A71668